MKIWQIAAPTPSELAAGFPELNPVVLQLLYNRGWRTLEDLRLFLRAETDYLPHDPFLFRDMEAAVNLLITHIKAGNKILVYGDYDADGVTASSVIYDTLTALKGKVDIYLPDRVSEGYGLNKAAIDTAAANGVKLIITVDTGIRNREEVRYAQSLGLEVIVTDHHILPEDRADLPPCLIINPADTEDKYPFRYLAGVGVAFKVAEALASRSTLTDDQKKILVEKNLDLVAVGTVADMVKLLDENRQLVKRGLKVLNFTRRPGLQELIKISLGAKATNAALSGFNLDAGNIGFQLAPRLNAASRMDHANSALALLLAPDTFTAQRLAGELNQKNADRQGITETIMAESEMNLKPEAFIIISVCPEDSAWNEGVVGLVAGRLCEKYYRPALVIAKTEDGYKGSGRSIEEFNLIEAVESAAPYLDKYGGHPMACGFSLIGDDNLKLFINHLENLAKEKLSGLDLRPKLYLDMALIPAAIDLRLAATIEQLAPFGQAFPKPKFAFMRVAIDEIMILGVEGRHLKFRFGQIWAVAFGKAEEYKDLKVGDIVDVAFYLEINEFNGRREPQLKVLDICLNH
jgi:single-stranded-DNA-specific exonuclease